MARTTGIEPVTPGWKPGTLPLRYVRIKWWTLRELNPRPLACRASVLPTELRAQELWWTYGESNPIFWIAKPVCSRYHYRPRNWRCYGESNSAFKLERLAS